MHIAQMHMLPDKKCYKNFNHIGRRKWCLGGDVDQFDNASMISRWGRELGR